MYRHGGALMRQVFLVVVMVLGVAWPVSADVTVIYRRTNQAVAGWLRPPHSVAVEIQNIVNSDFGGSVDDYGTVVLANLPNGHRPVVQADGTVSTEPYPEPEKPIEIPIESFGGGAAGALAAFAGRGLVLRVRKRKDA